MSLQIGRYPVDNLLMNASGPLCTSIEELEVLCQTKNKFIVTKTITKEPRSGNPHPRVAYDSEGLWSINSTGLANYGSEFYRDNLLSLKQKYPNKLFVCSISASNSEELCEIIFRLDTYVADIFEVNLSCPNLIGKRQIAFDMETSNRMLSEVKKETDKDIWVKLPPYQDFFFVEEMAEILVRNKISAAVCINSPSGLYLDWSHQTYIHPNGGMGGIGGADILPIALWNVRKFYLEFNKYANPLSVIGVGGIKSRASLLRHILCGAKAVQIGSLFLAKGPGIFESLNSENISDLHGKLEIIPPIIE